MAWALVGSAGTVAVGSSGAAVTPGWGTGENRTAGNLLVLYAFTSGATGGVTPAGWTLWGSSVLSVVTGTISIFHRVATGADAAPTLGAVTSGTITAQLAEFSGNASVSPADQGGGGNGTASPIVFTMSARDTGVGDLAVFVSMLGLQMAATITLTPTLNNGGGTAVQLGNNSSTSVAQHYLFGYAVLTSNAVADSLSLAYSSTSTVNGATQILASYKPAAAAALLVGQHHRRPMAVAPRRDVAVSRGRF